MLTGNYSNSSKYRFKTNHHEGYGHYVVEMNGIHEDVEQELFWVLLRRDHPDIPHSDCTIGHGMMHHKLLYLWSVHILLKK